MPIPSDRGLMALYSRNGLFCEMFGNDTNTADHTKAVRDRLNQISLRGLRRRSNNAEKELFNLGIV